MNHLNQTIENTSTSVMYLRQLEQEKLKISRELHDTALQDQIIALRELDLLLTEPELENMLELKKRLIRVREQQANSIYTLRNFCQTHFVPRLSDGELRHHIQFLLDHLQLRTNIEVIYANHWKKNLEGERALHTYRIIQELLNNTEKHANAKVVELILSQDNDYYEIHYKDDGVGWDGSLSQYDCHEMMKLGMKGLFSRAEYLQAEVKLNSSKQTGFQIMLRFPMSG